MATSVEVTVAEPSILWVNTYFFKPDSTASGRRRKEEHYLSTVGSFFSNVGFDVVRGSDYVKGEMQHEKYGKIVVVFTYSESCSHVYRSLSVTRDGKKSNITLLRKLYF